MGIKRLRYPYLLILVFSFVYLQGCYYVGPAPVAVAPAPSITYDVAWDSALRAADDVGIQVTSSDIGSGTILGQRGSMAIKIVVSKQDDGKIRVEMDFQGTRSQTQQIADEFYRAYDRYMGRH